MSIYEIFSIIFLSVRRSVFPCRNTWTYSLPDTYSRLHALTKADNLGLGFMVLGLVFVSGSVPEAIKLGLIWFLALIGSSSACYFIGNHMHISSQSGKKENGTDI
jgi:multicomponent Na+:H+ antiporter subunit G